MNRRSFLQILASAAAGAVVDPELLLWKPGAKTIFLPTPSGTPLTYAMLAQVFHRLSERAGASTNLIYGSKTIVDQYRRLLQAESDPRSRDVLRELAVMDTSAAVLPSGAKVDGLYHDVRQRVRAVVMEHPKWRGKILAGVEPVHPIKFTNSGLIHYVDDGAEIRSGNPSNVWSAADLRFKFYGPRGY
jgi:hypothetical protein